MPASPPAPLVPHHPSENGSFLPASTPHIIECPLNSLYLHSDHATISTFALLARCLSPTPHQGTPVPRLPFHRFRFALTDVAPPTAIRLNLVSWFVFEDSQTFWLPPP